MISHWEESLFTAAQFWRKIQITSLFFYKNPELFSYCSMHVTALVAIFTMCTTRILIWKQTTNIFLLLSQSNTLYPSRANIGYKLRLILQLTNNKVTNIVAYGITWNKQTNKRLRIDPHYILIILWASFTLFLDWFLITVIKKFGCFDHFSMQIEPQGNHLTSKALSLRMKTLNSGTGLGKTVPTCKALK